jgi:anti-sigma B factor antagonist
MASITQTRILVETIGEVTVAGFADSELVAEEVIAEVGEQLGSLIPALGPKVLLNFRGVRLMSSTMLAVLFRFSGAVRRAGGRLKLCSIDPDLIDVFRITRFDRLFEIHPDEWSALDAFEAGPPSAARV